MFDDIEALQASSTFRYSAQRVLPKVLAMKRKLIDAPETLTRDEDVFLLVHMTTVRRLPEIRERCTCNAGVAAHRDFCALMLDPVDYPHLPS